MRFMLGFSIIVAGGLVSGAITWALSMVHPVAGIVSVFTVAPLIGVMCGEWAYRVSP